MKIAPSDARADPGGALDVDLEDDVVAALPGYSRTRVSPVPYQWPWTWAYSSR